MKQKIVLVAALATLATPVWAVDVELGALASFDSQLNSVIYPTVPVGYASFDDTFNFSIFNEGSGIYSVAVEFQGYPTSSGGYSLVEFYLRDVTVGSEADLADWVGGGSGFPDWNTNFFSSQIYEPLDVSHSYQVEVRGTGDSSAGGSYNLTLTVEMIPTPVPEPETYAMLLAGLGLLGWSARRRRQN